MKVHKTCQLKDIPAKIIKMNANIFASFICLHKTCQLKDIPTKIIKMNADIFASFICLLFNYCIDTGEFPQVFKYTDITHVHKKVIKLITNLSPCYRTFLKFMKN